MNMRNHSSHKKRKESRGTERTQIEYCQQRHIHKDIREAFETDKNEAEKTYIVYDSAEQYTSSLHPVNGHLDAAS